MKEIEFYKYQGTGNDFVIIDDRKLQFDIHNVSLINHLCDRKFGIGADGLMLLQPHKSLDFKMVYFNADGNPSSMCGNGGRCIVQFASDLNIINNKTTFEAVDGIHHAILNVNDIVSLHMGDVNDIINQDTHSFTNTGSPHHVQFTDDIASVNVFEQGKKLRYSLYGDAGANINFVQIIENNNVQVRTYERGVEDETLSCGTGVTAVALVMHALHKTEENIVQVKTLGGNLEVSFKKVESGYRDIWLTGPATFVFNGVIKI